MSTQTGAPADRWVTRATSRWTRHLAEIKMRVRPAKDTEAAGMVSGPASTLEVEQAWKELKDHPHLLWVPPLWRALEDNQRTREVMRNHAVSAIECNLVIDVGRDENGQLRIRLATGPLHDRATAEGLDPTGAAGSVDPKLDVVAATFPDAVVKLRNALVENYPTPKPIETGWSKQHPRGPDKTDIAPMLDRAPRPAVVRGQG